MKQRGQALVETAIVIPLFLVIILATVDVWPALANLIIAKNLSARGARAAAVSLPPDDCPTLVTNAIGTPDLFFSDLSYTMPCVSGQIIAQSEPVTVTVTLNYHPVFWGGTWTLQVETTDYGR